MSKFLLLIAKIIFFFHSIHSQTTENADNDFNVNLRFFSFKNEFKKLYASIKDYEFRKSVFHENLKQIDEFNHENSRSFTLGVNSFTDLTWDEFRSKFLGRGIRTSIFSFFSSFFNPKYKTPPLFKIPFGRENERKDWSTITTPNTVVGEVTNQGECGSCWAFSGVAAVESAYVIFKNENPDLSEQQLVDCSTDGGNNGCDGGWETGAMTYIRDLGVVSTRDYPYLAKKGICNKSIINQKKLHKIKSWSYVEKGPEKIIEILKNQPVTASIFVDRLFQNYKSGIYTVSECWLKANHALLTVGYVLDPVHPYFIVKNQWGKSWGENGYIRISMAQGDGVCGFSTAKAAAYPSF